ncbi:unnamed protein product [Urochloa humidicola]
MPSLSSPLAPKGRPMTTKHTTTAVLLILISIIVLLASSCEARGLRVHGKGRSSSKSSHLPGKDVAKTSLQADDWGRRQTEAGSTVHTAIDEDDHMMAQVDAKAKERVAMSSSSTVAAGNVGATPVVRISQRLSRREDTGFHLDYAGPRTHTPSHN